MNITEKRKIMVPAILVGVRGLSDRGLAINFHTKEMSSVEKSVVHDFQGHHGFLLFAEDAFQESDVPKENSDMGGKSQSERLYNVLYVLYKQLNEPGDWKTFYYERMEQIIANIRLRLV